MPRCPEVIMTMFADLQQLNSEYFHFPMVGTGGPSIEDQAWIWDVLLSWQYVF